MHLNQQGWGQEGQRCCLSDSTPHFIMNPVLIIRENVRVWGSHGTRRCMMATAAAKRNLIPHTILTLVLIVVTLAAALRLCARPHGHDVSVVAVWRQSPSVFKAQRHEIVHRTLNPYGAAPATRTATMLWFVTRWSGRRRSGVAG